jgi:hypothetical protein
VRVQFTPTAPGDHLGELSLDYAGTSTVISLQGTLTTPADCTPDRITIATTGKSSLWEEPAAWQRQQGEGALPTQQDVVRLNSGTVLVGLPLIQVKALCIEAGAVLSSRDDRGTSLVIEATDYVQNIGQILGLPGANAHDQTCTDPEPIGTADCAMPGASVIIKVGSQFQREGKLGDWWWHGQGGPILNFGEIKAGDGGSGSHYGAPGGDALVLGRNTTNQGIIQAGKGGDVTGDGTGQGGQGGLTQIWGKLGGEGHLYNQNGAQALAGDGGHCRQPTSQIGGRGGNLWLVSLPDVYLSNGIQRAGQGGHHGCQQRGEDGWVQIEPQIIDLSGPQTRISGGDITIFGGNDWVLDLSNTSQQLLDASGHITLAVGAGGRIDLRGNHDILLRANGQINLFADEIQLDPGTPLRDLMTANQIVVGPAQVLRDVSLVGAQHVVGQPRTALPITLTLSNNAPQTDTYDLKISNTAHWVFDPPGATVTVAGLTSTAIDIHLTLPATEGATNRLIVTAISQADPQITATAQVPVTVMSQAPLIDTRSLNEFLVTQGMNHLIPVPYDAVTTTVVVTATSDQCPLQHRVIDHICRNHQQVLRDINFGPNARVAGGKLAGINHNQGWLSQITIEPDAQVNGGILTGWIVNHGTLTDIEFVGERITGGTLAGTVVNNSSIGGVLADLSLAPGAVIHGGIIAGKITGQCDAPARLEQVIVQPGSQLSCVVLGKDVILPADVILQAVPIASTPPVVDTPQPSNLLAVPTTARNDRQQPVATTALLAGGIAVNQQTFQLRAETTAVDSLQIWGQIQADPAHLNQSAELLVYGYYEPQSESPLGFQLVKGKRPGQPQIEFWDGQEPVRAFDTIEQLPESYLLSLYEGLLSLAAGRVEVWWGYRVQQSGKVVEVIPSQAGIEIVIEDSP